MSKFNPLSLIRSVRGASRYFGTYVTINMECFQITGYSQQSGYALPWAIRNQRGRNLNAQSMSPSSAWYIQPLPFDNTLAQIGHSREMSAVYIGKPIVMWSRGFRLDQKPDCEGRITKFDPYTISYDPWWCLLDHGQTWHSQADKPTNRYYIILREDWERGLSSEEFGAADMLSRAFLGK